MPIEFRCTQCQKLLRTPDNSAGKQVRCPGCGAVLTIPAASAAPPPQEPAAGGYTPPPPPPAPPEPFAAEAADNPYESPLSAGGQAEPPYTQSREYALGRVSNPATALIVTGGLGIAVQILGLVNNLVGMMMAPGAMPGGMPGGMPPNMPPEAAQQFKAIMMVSGTMGLVFGLIGLAIGAVVIVGALKMKKLESYGFAMASSIVAMIPCISPCCVLGLPFGIWALVVLSDAQVKEAFRG